MLTAIAFERDKDREQFAPQRRLIASLHPAGLRADKCEGDPIDVLAVALPVDARKLAWIVFLAAARRDAARRISRICSIASRS